MNALQQEAGFRPVLPNNLSYVVAPQLDRAEVALRFARLANRPRCWDCND